MSFQKLFIKSKGQPIIYNGREIKMIDKIPLQESDTKIKLIFLHSDSVWKQGIVLQTKGHFEANNKKVRNKIILWEHIAPKEIELKVISEDKIIIVYNVWETEDGTTHYWHNGGAMYIEENGRIRVYNCNDGFADDDFNDLIFQISW